MDAVTISVFKSWMSRVNRQWVNTYEAIGPNGLAGAMTDVAEYVPLAEAIVAAEIQLHWSRVQFLRYTIRTWLPDSNPYDPDALVTTPLDDVGARSAVTDATTVDLRVVWRIDRVALHGRPGRAFYRGAIDDSAIQATGGRVEWQGPFSAMTLYGAQLTAYQTALAPYLGVEGAAIGLALIGGTLHKTVVPKRVAGEDITVIKRTYTTPYHGRSILAMNNGGPTLAAQEHAYFDRAA